VGIVFVGIIQPTHTILSDFGMLAVGIDQNACPLGQSGDFSEKVAREPTIRDVQANSGLLGEDPA
jgi:hypothetical protein